MRFALVTITFFLENTNDVMQTNEFKLTKGDKRQPALVRDQNTGPFFFVWSMWAV